MDQRLYDKAYGLLSGLQNDALRVTSRRFSMKRRAYPPEDEIYLPLNLEECRGVLMMDAMALRSSMPSSVPFLNPDHLCTCSFDRKR